MKRKIEEVLVHSLKKWRCVALMGARQVGKSYLMKEVVKKYGGTIISFDDPVERQEALRDPVAYLKNYFVFGKFLFIDEAIKVPEIFNAVKVIVDEYDPKPAGICLASSANYLMIRKIRETLAGRVHLLKIFPFSWQEVNNESGEEPGIMRVLRCKIPAKSAEVVNFVKLNRAREDFLVWGGFPSIVLNRDAEMRKLWVRNYIHTYILPVVVEQFNIREAFAFEQAVMLLLHESANLYNANRLAQNIGISQPTAFNYIKYLEAMMVINTAAIYHKNPLKRLIKHPKLYVCDSALINESLGNNFKFQHIVGKGEIGLLYESFVFNEIQKLLANYALDAGLYAWRTQDDAEVDIVLHYNGKLIPFEVKWSKQPGKNDISGLNSFMECYPDVKKAYIIYPGKEIIKLTKNITALPDWWLLGSAL